MFSVVNKNNEKLFSLLWFNSLSKIRFLLADITENKMVDRVSSYPFSSTFSKLREFRVISVLKNRASIRSSISKVQVLFNDPVLTVLFFLSGGSKCASGSSFFWRNGSLPPRRVFSRLFVKNCDRFFFSDILRASKIVRAIRWDNTSDAKILRTTWHHEIRFLNNLNSTIVIVFSYKIGSQNKEQDLYFDFKFWILVLFFKAFGLTLFVKFDIRPTKFLKSCLIWYRLWSFAWLDKIDCFRTSFIP